MAEKTKNYGFSTPGLDGAANITLKNRNRTIFIMSKMTMTIWIKSTQNLLKRRTKQRF